MCPRCGKEKAIVHPQYGLLQGKKCLAKSREISSKVKSPPEFFTQTMTDRIGDQRIKYEADIKQPYIDGVNPDPEFVKIYPELARDYFTQEQLEKL